MSVNTMREAAQHAAAAKANATGKPKVSEESIKARIRAVDYLCWPGTFLTLCKITMSNGFHVIGHSAPASPENFDFEIGKNFAYGKAFDQLWALEGYLLREALEPGHPLLPPPVAPAKRVRKPRAKKAPVEAARADAAGEPI